MSSQLGAGSSARQRCDWDSPPNGADCAAGPTRRAGHAASRPDTGTLRRLFQTAALLAGSALALALLAVNVLPSVNGLVSRPMANLLDAVMVAAVVAPLVGLIVLLRHPRADRDLAAALAGRRGALAALLTVVAGLSGAGVAAWTAAKQAEATDYSRFQRLTERVLDEVQSRVKSYAAGLTATRGLWPASKSVERSEFSALIGSVDLTRELPGALGIGFIRRVPRAELAAFLESTRKDDAPDFEIDTSGNADELYVIEFVEPRVANRAAAGCDIAPDPKRRAAAERAMLTGESTLTEPLTIAQAETEGPGFYYFLPVYAKAMPTATPEERRAALQGWVYMSIVAARLFAGLDAASHDELHTAIYHETAGSEAQLVFAAQTPPGVAVKNPRAAYTSLSQAHGISVGGQRWGLLVSTTPLFASASRAAVWALGGGGMLLALLAAGLMLTLGGTAARARAMAESMTATLRESERVTRLLAENTSDLVGLVSADGRSLFLSPSVYRTLGYSAAELASSNWRTRVHPDDLPEVEAAHAANLAGQKTCVRYRALKKDGSHIWLECTASAVMAADGLRVEHIVWSSRDVTAQIEAEGHRAAQLEMATLLARAADVTEAARVVCDVMERVTGVHRTAVLLYGDDGRCRFVGWRGISDAYRRAVEGHCPWKEGERDAQPLLVADALNDASLAPYRELFAREQIGSLAFVPVITEKGVAGKLMLYGDQPAAISAETVANTWVIAASLGVAVGRLRATAELARREARLANTTRMAKVGWWEMDAETGAVEWSAEVAEIHEVDEGFKPNLQAAPLFFQGEALRTLEQSVRLAIEQQQPYEWILPFVTAKGRRRRVRSLGQPVVRDGRVVRLTGAFQDVTEQEEAREKAEAASRAKSDFLANMSHEIRTPMTAILGYADVLADDGDGPASAARRQETIATIKRNGEHLLSIINDILDISKIEAGKLAVESIPTDPVQVVEDVVSLMLVRSHARGIRLERNYGSAIPRSFPCDPLRLRQILVNLVGNAIKFTEQGSVTINVSLDRSRPERPMMRFEVADTGMGLHPAQVAELFQPFAQADETTTRRFGGTGLGLVIARRLAEMLGGEIDVTSEPGQGSVFVASVLAGEIDEANLWSPDAATWAAETMRESADSRAADARRVSGARPLAAVRVLLAEDGPDNQRLIAYHLKKAGAMVQVVDNGRQAVQAMTIRGDTESPVRDPAPFDLILLDMQMPEMDGYTAARILRSLTCRVPILALTAHAMSGDREKCLKAGCDEYATKPIDAHGLIECCARLVLDRAGSTA
ncbi:MAG: Sensor histidine kinase RcsC [Phycisphaerae bacterium]|nr:Sensor histidine kinase RcsC [Phycisphaerae bacterium]